MELAFLLRSFLRTHDREQAQQARGRALDGGGVRGRLSTRPISISDILIWRPLQSYRLINIGESSCAKHKQTSELNLVRPQRT